MTDIQKLAELIKNSNKIVFFGGAGVSTESGVKDYRSKDGIYNAALNYGKPPEEILSHGCFFDDTELFYRFYRDYFLGEAEPNYTHYALAELEKSGKQVTVVTQNVDSLHQKAGSKNVLELHGSVARNYCTKCKKDYTAEYIKNYPENVPRCECGGVIKPYVTLYGESLDDRTVNEAVYAIANADLLIIGGTSLAVYPAASFVRYYRGDNLVIINRESTSHDSYASLVFHDSLGKIFREVMEIIK